LILDLSIFFTPIPPIYAAPEVCDTSRGPQTPAMDVYSFGVLSHEMCSRRQPLGELTIAAVNEQGLQWRPPERLLPPTI